MFHENVEFHGHLLNADVTRDSTADSDGRLLCGKNVYSYSVAKSNRVNSSRILLRVLNKPASAVDFFFSWVRIRNVSGPNHSPSLISLTRVAERVEPCDCAPTYHCFWPRETERRDSCSFSLPARRPTCSVYLPQKYLTT